MRRDTSLLDSFTTFGDLLKYLRVSARLTQRDLSIAVGYSEAQISRQESNKRIPSNYVLKALFVPALGLDEPEIISRLLALAEKAREMDHPLAVSFGEEKIFLTARHNLPRHLTSFIGRDKEVEQVIGLVREHPLVTLTGAGGVGKTRLALQAALKLVDDFPDGVWLVELAQLIDPVFVPIAVASIFNTHSAPGQRLIQTLREYLASKCLLLILDNCEHVIDAVAELSTSLLGGCPNLSILATSREILNVEGEFFYRCPSLTLPDSSPGHPSISILKRVEDSEAVRLFIDRAAAASPGFCLNEQNAANVAEICQRLDGIPLAIELAAARLRLLSLPEIVGHMNNVFELIAGSRRSVQARHKTLKAMIEWSYELLTPIEQALLRRLSTFVGGWTLAAAEAVAGGEVMKPDEVLDGMQHLVDKSLIFVEITEYGESRFRMLETIRQYAGEKLREAEEYSMVRDRHLIYFARMAGQVFSTDPTHIVSSLDAKRLMREYDNARLALAWSLETNIELGLRICLSLTDVIPFHLYFEIGAWLEKLLKVDAEGRDRPERQGNTAQMDFLRGVALLNIGESSYLWGQRSRSEKALLESIAIFEAAGEKEKILLAIGQMHMGCLLICTDPEQSRRYLEGSQDTFRRTDGKAALASCDRMMVAMYIINGDFPRAREMANEDLRLNQELFGGIGPPALEYAGSVEFLSGNYDRAIEYFHQAMESGVQLESHHQAAYMSWMEGCAALANGKIMHLLRLSEEMVIKGQQTGISGWFFYADALLAMLEWTQGEYDQAVKRSEEGLARYYPDNLSYTIAFPYVLGRVALARGDLARAEQYFRQMDEMANAPPVWRWKPVSLHVFGLLAAVRLNQRIKMAERAAVLFGAQQKLFAWLPNVLTSFERDEYARALSLVKEILGKKAFGAAWDKGQAMSHQQAFALALEETGENLV